jgi:hypothetical protein
VTKLLVSLARQYASDKAEAYILKDDWFVKTHTKLTSSMEMSTQSYIS